MKQSSRFNPAVSTHPVSSNPAALNKVYYAIIQPHFDYCSSVWDNCNKGFKEKLQKLQNRAGRVITRSGYDIRSAEILEKLGWLTLEHRWHLNKALFEFDLI